MQLIKEWNSLSQEVLLFHALLLIEAKLFLRNRHTKLLFSFSVFYGLVGIIFNAVNGPETSIDIAQMFAIYLSLGAMFSLTLARTIFSWDSHFFDKIVVSQIRTHQYILSKVLMIDIINLSFFLINIAIFWFLETEMLYLLTSVFLYIVGILNFFHVYLANFAQARININGGLLTSGTEKFFGFPTLLSILAYGLPVLIPGILSMDQGIELYQVQITLWFGVPGIIGLLLGPLWIKCIVSAYKKNRYQLAKVFRIE